MRLIKCALCVVLLMGGNCYVANAAGQASTTKKLTVAKKKTSVTSILSGSQKIVSGTTTTSTTGTSASTADGLKEALVVGVTNAVLVLHKEDGYLGNQLLKILLPADAQSLIDNIKMVPGGQKMLDDVVVRLNRAAEDAAGDAKPIFVEAIKNMSIVDATNILFGKDKEGATNYLRKTTSGQLTNAFRPKIDASLDKELVAGMSTNTAWSRLTTAYNKVAKSFVGVAANLTPVTTNLGEHVTEKALNGMFVTVGSEEAKIRENPAARVNSILQSVFGQLDKK